MRWLLPLSIAAAACSFEEVDLRDKMCPCAEGWVCDPDTVRCVALVARDAGLDAEAAADGEAPTDAEPRDALGVDARGGGDAGIDAGLDAGVDAGADAGLDDTACDDVHASALFCDGFEAGAGFPDWSDERGATYATAPVYRGAFSARAASSPSSTFGYLYEGFPETTSGDLYARMYVHLGGGENAEALALLHLEEAGSPYDYAQIDLRGGNLRLSARNREGSMQADGPAMPRDRWVCLELGFGIGPGATIELFVDGTSVASLTANTALTNPWQVLYAGISHRGTAQTGEVELFMDEVVLARSRIGCD